MKVEDINTMKDSFNFGSLETCKAIRALLGARGTEITLAEALQCVDDFVGHIEDTHVNKTPPDYYNKDTLWRN